MHKNEEAHGLDIGVALVTLVNSAAWSLMNINEVDLITVGGRHIYGTATS